MDFLNGALVCVLLILPVIILVDLLRVTVKHVELKNQILEERLRILKEKEKKKCFIPNR